jgi:phospholipid transport system transporter-binding protein
VSGAQLTRRDDRTWSLEGDVTLASVPVLLDQAEQLFEAGAKRIVDLARVRRIDSSSVALLLEWQRQAQARGLELRFRNIPWQMVAIARLCGVDALLSLDAMAAA